MEAQCVGEREGGEGRDSVEERKEASKVLVTERRRNKV